MRESIEVFRFGQTGKQLFGIVHMPKAVEKPRAVLFCNPFGQEAIRCHRLYRVMCTHLVRQGFTCMRFDYSGTGDSDGELEIASLRNWCEDTLVASKMLASYAKTNDMVWFGLGLGGTIAAMASLQLTDALSHLVLWDPVSNGSLYLQECAERHDCEVQKEYGSRWQTEPLLRKQLLMQKQVQLLGFEMPMPLREAISGIDATTFAKVRSRRTTLFREPSRAYSANLSSNASQQSTWTTIDVQTGIHWASNEAMNTSLVPTKIVDQVVVAISSPEQ